MVTHSQMTVRSATNRSSASALVTRTSLSTFGTAVRETWLQDAHSEIVCLASTAEACIFDTSDQMWSDIMATRHLCMYIYIYIYVCVCTSLSNTCFVHVGESSCLSKSNWIIVSPRNQTTKTSRSCGRNHTRT